MPSAEAPAYLAKNVAQLRELRGWTQHQLATHAGVPRPTVANLESGSANPTLAVLVRVATALQVTLDELVGPPRATARKYLAAEVPTSRRGQVEVRQLLPDALPGITVERLGFAARGALGGVPHKAGTREYLTCERGRVALVAGGEAFELAEGDVVVFRGDQPHSYRALDDAPAVAYSVVLP